MYFPLCAHMDIRYTRVNSGAPFDHTRWRLFACQSKFSNPSPLRKPSFRFLPSDGAQTIFYSDPFCEFEAIAIERWTFKFAHSPLFLQKTSFKDRLPYFFDISKFFALRCQKTNFTLNLQYLPLISSTRTKTFLADCLLYLFPGGTNHVPFL